MADIRPFRGYIYNKEKIKDISEVLAPPYDVISPEMQDSLYKKSDFNVVRLIFGKEQSDDDDARNKYKRAKVFFEDLINKKVLIKDESPCVYIYGQTYTALGKEKKRIGFISLMKLENPETSKVLPHEHTFLYPKKDRLKLIQYVEANLSCIFSIFQDDEGAIGSILERESQKTPIFDIYYEDVRQRLWRIPDTQVISNIKEAMRDKQIFIADGHHRYEVALAFRDEMRLKAKGISPDTPYNYIMMYFTSLDEAKLTILATHRLIKDIGGLDNVELITRIEKYFEVKKFNNFDKMQLAQKNMNKKFIFGMYCNDGYYLLELKDILSAESVIRGKKPVEWKRLDVTILHNFILKRILKITDEGDNIIYLKDAEAAIDKVKKGGYKLAFFLNPTRLEEVKTIAQIGEKMPYKSTYFYPKLLSGIVINKFD